jgi:hypothetical protein
MIALMAPFCPIVGEKSTDNIQQHLHVHVHQQIGHMDF